MRILKLVSLFTLFFFASSYQALYATESQGYNGLLEQEVHPYQEANGGILEIEEISLNQTSQNYSPLTPSGNSSVYFYIPTEQDNIIQSDFTRAKRSLWSSRAGVSKVTALVTNTNTNQQHQAILSVQKKFRGRWLRMNDGVQRGHGQVKVSFDANDNPNLAAGNYTTEFMIIGAGWHNTSYRVAVKAKIDFKVYENFIQSEVHPYQEANGGILEIEEISLN